MTRGMGKRWRLLFFASAAALYSMTSSTRDLGTLRGQSKHGTPVQKPSNQLPLVLDYGKKGKGWEMKWPESTCVECGCKIPSGQMQRCAEGGYCSWRVPKALRALIESEIPEEIAIFMWGKWQKSRGLPESCDGWMPLETHNAQVIEAYRRGKESK